MDVVHVNGHDRTSLVILAKYCTRPNGHDRTSLVILAKYCTRPNGHDRTSLVILAKYCTRLPDYGSSVIRNVLEYF